MARRANHRPTGFRNSHTGAWELGTALMPPISPDPFTPPRRPLLVFIVDPSGLVRASAIGWPDNPDEPLTEAWEESIERPANGCRRGLPERVTVPNAALLQQIQPLLAGIPVEVGPTPGLEQAMDVLQDLLEDGDPELDDDASAPEAVMNNVGDCFAADVKSSDLIPFFKTCAVLHQRQPWYHVPSDQHIFRLTCSSLNMRAWIGCVIGQEETQMGLILFEKLSDYQRYTALATNPDSLRQGRIPQHRAISFEAWDDFSPEFHADIQTRLLTLSPSRAIPIALQVTSEPAVAPADLTTLKQLQASAEAICKLIDDVPDLANQWQRANPVSKRYRLDSDGHSISITISPITLEQAKTTTASQATTGRIPAALQDKAQSLIERIQPFCTNVLNDEYERLIHNAVAALARKRPSPLLSGRESSWCAGIVHAVGMANFLFDDSQSPHCKASDIYSFFGVSAQTGQSHSKKVRDSLKMDPFQAKWTLPSRAETSSLCWMVEVNGFIVDARKMSVDIQVEACAKGLIPYVPALRTQQCA